MRDLHIGQTITNRESRSVESYLNEIGKVSLITAEEEADLARKIKAGDRAAVNRLAKVNLRFVVSVAKKYQNMGIPLGDLINEGNFGLIRAAEKFDETKGFKFISFAVWWIRQAILEAVSQQSRMIRLPNNQIGMMSRVNRTIAALEQTEERLPTPEELAGHLDTALFKVKDALWAAPRTSSFDAPLPHTEESLALLERIPLNQPAVDSNLMAESGAYELDSLLGTLSDRERKIIELTYGLGVERDLSAPEIGELLGFCPERVRQIRQVALAKLRQSPRVHTLLDA
jgi:RNA polymerase primary sigma factor